MDKEPKSLSTRIAFLTIFLMSLVLFAMYHAALTSFLAVLKIQMPFVDIYDLYLNTDYQVVTIKETATEQSLKTGSEVAQNIYKERIVLKNNLDEAMEVLENGKTALFWDDAIMSARVGKTCEVAKVQTCYYSSPVVFSVKKYFLYNGIISYR